MAKEQGSKTKPKVVFDPKMPRYEYREGNGHSLSVDRKRTVGAKPPVDCLSNIRI
jgi:hypothetical protein